MIGSRSMKTGKLALLSLMMALGIQQPVLAEAGPAVQRVKVLGPPMSTAESMQATADGGRILTGEVREAGGNIGMLLLKSDAEGRQQWSRTIYHNGSWLSSGTSVHQTKDGGFIAVGTTVDADGRPQDDVMLVKTDAEGTLQWETRLGKGVHDSPADVAELPDGGYIIAGTVIAGSIPGSAGTIIRTDREGRELWARMYGDLEHSSGTSLNALLPLKDGTFAAAGTRSSSFNSNDGKAYIMCINDQGELQWEREFVSVGGGRAGLYDIRSTDDGGFIATGFADQLGGNRNDLYLLKLDKDWRKQWEAIHGGAGSDAGHAVRPTEDGGYIASGRTGSQAGWNDDLWIVKTDGSGKPQWQQKVGGSGTEHGTAILQTGKGAYLAAGYTTAAEDIPSAVAGASAAQGRRILLVQLYESAAENPGGGSGDQPQEQPVSIEFERASYDVPPGKTAPTVLTAVYGNGEKRPLTGDVRFYSNDPRVASIDGRGVLHGITQGSTFLTAEYQGRTANATVTVGDPKGPKLTGLAAESERLNLSAGSVGQLRLKALYDDGSAKDVTAQARLYMNDTRIAVARPGGAIQSISPGSTFVTAEYDGLTEVIDVTVR